jgi:hypothetical protein
MCSKRRNEEPEEGNMNANPANTTRRLITLTLTTLSLLAALALMGANTGPTCAPIQTEEPADLCMTPVDCEGLAHDDCEGQWACVDATCHWTCDVVIAGCYSDSDCDAGFHCSVSDGDCGSDPTCPMCGVCFGECVPDAPPPIACWDNGDCPDGQICDPDACLPPPGCEEGMACPAVCYGQCVDPQPGGCSNDADCGPQQFCDFSDCPVWMDADEMYCAEGDPACMPPDCGMCQDLLGDCNDDADCGLGFQCVLEVICAEPICEGDECWGECAQFGFCEPVEEHECFDDDDCKPGTHCEITSWCGGDAEGAPEPTDGWCGGGVCVPDEIPGCLTNEDCPEGFICEYLDGPCGDPEVDCLPYAQCVPAPIQECLTNEDCPAGFVCELYECPPNALCEPLGQCVPAPVEECFTDAECGDGAFCVFPEGDGCCPINAYCAGLLPPCVGTCAPFPDDTCYSDADCGPGEICQDTPTAQACCPEGAPCLPEMPPCGGVCVPAPQEECFTHADCAMGFDCVIDQPSDMCCDLTKPDEICLMAFPPCTGHCEPSTAADCQHDGDCAGGEHCAFDQPCPVPDCPPGADCMPAYCPGSCRLDADRCWDDADCGPAEACEGAFICPEDGTCFAPDQAGTCEPLVGPGPCQPTGCSGQLCLPFDIASTCEWIPYYACYDLAQCSTFADGSCGWVGGEEFTACMIETGGPGF